MYAREIKLTCTFRPRDLINTLSRMKTFTIYGDAVGNVSGPWQKRQDAQLSQRDHAAGCVIVFAKSRRLELGDNILRTL